MSDYINVIESYKKINFSNRYKIICENHKDFNNRLRGNKKELYSSIINRLGYTAKYFKSETFYRIEEEIGEFTFIVQLVLKNGLVETMIHLKKNSTYCVPAGRFDFMAEEIDDSYDRKKYNLPDYTSGEELEIILKGIFSIYEDLKKELINAKSI